MFTWPTAVGKITKEKALTALERLRKALRDDVIDKAIEVLEKAGHSYERIKVPGCFEIPATLSIAHACELYDGYVTLGCVIRGETSHYDYVCTESARGINQYYNRPVILDPAIEIGIGFLFPVFTVHTTLNFISDNNGVANKFG